MKWKKKLQICGLLAGLTALLGSGGNQQPSLRLLAAKSLSFPAASGMEFYQNRLYLFGDNAPYLLVLSRDYQPIDSFYYWKTGDPVIEKKDKPDIESAMLWQHNGKTIIAGVGSMSDDKRWQVYELSPESGRVNRTRYFNKNTRFPGLEELNIEGSTQVHNTVVFCNRANKKANRNHLLFWDGKDRLESKEIILPPLKKTTGLSGLYYWKEKDLLLFTASQEETGNAIQDGKIGDSFLGMIRNFSQKMAAATLQPDHLLRLQNFSPAFRRQKIESVCVESATGNRLLLHLAADNDDGKSNLFKAELRL